MDMTGKTQILLQKTHQKKVLALVLAFACAFTMFAGAAFTDSADINADNADAVELLTALNIIEGYEDGSFQPEGTVTRAEMAKMIFTIRNGGNDDASAYETVTTSFTDINGHWAEGYIKYLQNTGIVAGKSAYIFDPDSTVTTAEAMKMALVLSGYRADKANLTGSAWQNNTISQATTVGLTKDVFSAVAEGCTRQDAAQILSNTLTEVYAVQWSEVTNSFLNDSKKGLAWGGEPITVGEKWMDLEVHTGYLTKGPSSKTNPKQIDFTITDGTTFMGKTDVTFRNTQIDVSDLFGYEVKVVWDGEHYNDADGVYGIYKTADNEDTTAMWKDIKNETDGKVKLNDKTWTVDKEALDGSKRMEVYVNGSDVTTVLLDEDHLSKSFDEQATADIVTFIDNDGDGKIETAQVKNQNVVKITYVSDDVLNTSDLIADDAPVVQSELAQKTYDAGPDMSDVITYEGIAKNDYAKVTYDYYNDKVVYEKIDAVEGKIEATRTKNSTKEISIDGTWYKAAAGYTLPSLVTGDSIEYIAIDNLIYNAKKIDGTWGSKNLAVVYNVARYTAGVNANDIQISLITRDGTKKTAILDKYNNKDVEFTHLTGAPGSPTYYYNIDLDVLNTSVENKGLGDIRTGLVGRLVTYRENGSSVSLMPVKAGNYLDKDGKTPVKFRQLAGYDNVLEMTSGSAFNYNKDLLNVQLWDETLKDTVNGTDGKLASAANYTIADDAVVFAYWGANSITDGDAKVISGKDLKNLDSTYGFDTIIGGSVLGGTVNGVDYIQAMAIKLDKEPTTKGANYAYVLNASETADENDYRRFDLWTENGLLTAYEESSDEYYYGGGEIVTYDIVSTGDRTIIKNVTDISASGGSDKATIVGYISSDGFYGTNETKIAVDGVREYELAADCLVVNINTEDNEGIEGDAKSAARAARYDYKTNQYVKNVVYVLDTDDKIIFMLIDGKNNAIDDITKY